MKLRVAGTYRPCSRLVGPLWGGASEADLGETCNMPDFFEIIGTTRSMRRLKPDPVPDELIKKILEAGISAANGGKNQTWRFLVVKDPAIKKAVQVWYKKAFDEVVGPGYATNRTPPGVTAERYRK